MGRRGGFFSPNKDEIEGMMRKHGTEAKWKELLKNPTHPELAKYPQD